MRPSGAHTHPPSGPSVAVAVIAGAVALAALAHSSAARSAGHAAAHLITLALYAGLTILGLALAAGAVAAGLMLRRRRQPRPVERGWTATVQPPAPAPARELPARRTVTLGAPGPREVHYHVHLPPGADAGMIMRVLRDAPARVAVSGMPGVSGALTPGGTPRSAASDTVSDRSADT